jgi:hypothetical protein
MTALCFVLMPFGSKLAGDGWQAKRYLWLSRAKEGITFGMVMESLCF